MNPVHGLSEPVKHAVDALALGTLLATLFSWLPAIASVLTVLWLTMRLVESWQQIRLNGRKLRGE
jgi:hypothetical protein